MSIPPLKVPREEYNMVRSSIESAIKIGGDIRGVLGSQQELNPMKIYIMKSVEQVKH